MKYPLGASVPSLGLSNKAVSEDDCKNNSNQPKKKDYPEHYFIPLTLNRKFFSSKYYFLCLVLKIIKSLQKYIFAIKNKLYCGYLF